MLARSIDYMAADRRLETPASGHEVTERRSMVRVDLPFPATVRGVDADGERFAVDAVLDNLSAHGLYVRLARPIEQGARLFFCVELALTTEPGVCAPRVALNGVVLRVDPQPDGRCGIAVAFDHHRFLYASAGN